MMKPYAVKRTVPLCSSYLFSYYCFTETGARIAIKTVKGIYTITYYFFRCITKKL